MKKLAYAVVMVGMILCSGCASIYTTMAHNGNIREQAAAIKIQANNGGINAAVDVLNLQGYWGAWMAHPWQMGTATVLDAGTGWAGYAIYEHNRDNGKSDASLPASTTVPAAGNGFTLYNSSGNTFYVNSGDHNNAGDTTSGF